MHEYFNITGKIVFPYYKLLEHVSYYISALSICIMFHVWIDTRRFYDEFIHNGNACSRERQLNKMRIKWVFRKVFISLILWLCGEGKIVFKGFSVFVFLRGRKRDGEAMW